MRGHRVVVWGGVCGRLSSCLGRGLVGCCREVRGVGESDCCLLLRRCCSGLLLRCGCGSGGGGRSLLCFRRGGGFVDLWNGRFIDFSRGVRRRSSRSSCGGLRRSEPRRRATSCCCCWRCCSCSRSTCVSFRGCARRRALGARRHGARRESARDESFFFFENLLVDAKERKREQETCNFAVLADLAFSFFFFRPRLPPPSFLSSFDFQCRSALIFFYNRYN